MVSISGIRGVVGESLTPAVIEKYVLAFGKYLNGGTVIVGGDSRTSGAFIRDLVKGHLQASGCRVIDIGIATTPTVEMEILHHRAAGGIAVTASHNPPQWNGLKFMNSDGRFLAPDIATQVYSDGDRGLHNLQTWENIGSVQADEKAHRRHIEAILGLSYLDVEALKKRRFKVVVDCVNGAGGLIIPELLNELGCEAIVLNGEANGRFAHTPEPLPENLGELIAGVQETGADIGFAVDPDVDRCAIIDNTGTPIGEEYTLAATVKFILSKQLGAVVVNMSTSRASEDIAKYYNCPFYRTKVGEINVAEKMKTAEAIIGGEGNGGVILPELHLGRDAPVAVALLLQQLLEYGDGMHDLWQSLPQYKIVKDKISIEGIDPDKVIDAMADRHSDKMINLLDGLKIDTEQTWVHMRKSNTEPILRIMAEAPTEEEAKNLAESYKQEIQELAKKL